jgi:Asp-tRNA(Asn)/Glu-tRNA(Gln) amidotransferase A subunit family amidase
MAASYVRTHHGSMSSTPEMPSSAPQDRDGRPRLTPEDVAGAEGFLGIEFSAREREQMVGGLERRVGRFGRRRQFALPGDLAPAEAFDPFLGRPAPPVTRRLVAPKSPERPLPADPADIAYAPAHELSRWIRSGELTSVRLTEIYLERIARLDPRLHACITVTADLARAQAQRADDELAAGRWRGPLHGLPYGAKDLFDTDGIATTWGAAPYRDRVPGANAVVVERLERAGAVLLAKTSLGALAYGDLWFAERTRNPWNLEQGSSGSSAGSAAGVAAGLFAFALGTETYGSIVSPAMRCGATGLRPTFGRVPRTGTMALCWSLDKIGPLCRSVQDTAWVLDAIAGAHSGDPLSRDMPLTWDGKRPLDELTVGYSPDWFEGLGPVDDDEEAGVAGGDLACLEALRDLGVRLVEVELPQLPVDPLLTLLEVEAAAAFEELTRSGRDDELRWQDDAAWPNTFRGAWTVPAPEFVQAQRLRRAVCEAYAAAIAGVDLLISPSFAANLLLITNFTGHPCLCLRSGLQGGRTTGTTLWGQLAGEGDLLRVGTALEARLGVAQLRPDLD